MKKKFPFIAIAAVQNSFILKLLLLIPLMLLIGTCANNSAILLEEELGIEIGEQGKGNREPLSKSGIAATDKKATVPEDAQFITYEPVLLVPEEAQQIAEEQVLAAAQNVPQEQIMPVPQITQNVPQEPALPVPQIIQNVPQELPVEGQVLPVPPQFVAQAPQSLAPAFSAPEQPAEIPVLPPVIEQPAKPAIPVYILGQGQIDAEILSEFLVFYHPEMHYLSRELSTIYAEEAAIEGINHDVAFAQMCLETGFLRFGGLVLREMNNFCGLGAINATQRGLWFPDERTGVRAHIQHLKAYATAEPLNQELVDPRYQYVRLGSSPQISGLAGTWAADLQYGEKINSILERLYEFSFRK